MKTFEERVDWDLLEKGTYAVFLEFNGCWNHPGWKLYEFLQELIDEHEADSKSN